jgi:hypothetical protein
VGLGAYHEAYADGKIDFVVVAVLIVLVWAQEW